jgi:hypothetical protein
MKQILGRFFVLAALFVPHVALADAFDDWIRELYNNGSVINKIEEMRETIDRHFDPNLKPGILIDRIRKLSRVNLTGYLRQGDVQGYTGKAFKTINVYKTFVAHIMDTFLQVYRKSNNPTVRFEAVKALVDFGRLNTVGWFEGEVMGPYRELLYRLTGANFEAGLRNTAVVRQFAARTIREIEQIYANTFHVNATSSRQAVTAIALLNSAKQISPYHFYRPAMSVGLRAAMTAGGLGAGAGLAIGLATVSTTYKPKETLRAFEVMQNCAIEGTNCERIPRR